MANADSERWEALIAHDRIGELLHEVTIQQAAETWHRYHHRKLEDADDGSDDPDWWSIELALAIGRGGNEDRWRDFIIALVDSGVTEADFDNVGAGPIEEFVSDDESRVVWIEQHAAASDRFRRALKYVWVWGIESDEIAARLERAAGTRLARPKGWTGP